MRRLSQSLLILGFTAVFVGYLSVWLHGPGVGLTFLGVEMGEWFKFLGLGARRDLFYLPPIILGLMLSVWTWTWPEKDGFDWHAWTVRGLGVLVSLLTFPAIEDISGPVREQYLLRVVLIGLVLGAALVTGFWRPNRGWRRLPWLLLAGLGLSGALLPTWLYVQVQPFLSDILGVSVNAGLGFWLNILGNTLIVIICFYQMLTSEMREDKEIGVAY
jgi:hypothetical protein